MTDDIREEIANLITSEIFEGEFGQPIELISPTGDIYSGLLGNVIRDTIGYNEQGIEVLTHKPIVQIRLRSLSRIPQDGEKWICKITDVVSSVKTSYFVEKANIDGRSIGYIELNLSKAIQSS